MCSGVPILRLLAFIFLLIAFIVCFLGFLAPFWIQLNKSETAVAHGDQSDRPASSPTPRPTASAAVIDVAAAEKENFTGIAAAAITRKKKDDGDHKKKTDQQEGGDGGGGGEGEGPWIFEGLWAKCVYNVSFFSAVSGSNYTTTPCTCWAQNNFQLENLFPDWHKAAQGLFTIGLFLLFVTLLISGCYLCCRCCRESTALATVLGVFAIAGFLPIALSIMVYGGFAYHEKGVDLSGSEGKFAWAYYVSISGAAVVIVAALLFIVDGRRKVIVEHEDCETAKMV